MKSVVRTSVQDVSYKPLGAWIRNSHLLLIKGSKKKKIGKLNEVIGYAFVKKLGLDEGITSWDLKNRIPRRKLRI